MAVQVCPSPDVAEPAVIRHRAREMRLAARQALGRAVQAQVQATMQSAARVRSSPPTRGRGRGRRAGSSTEANNGKPPRVMTAWVGRLNSHVAQLPGPRSEGCR
jgi:hypothetical protein